MLRGLHKIFDGILKIDSQQDANVLSCF